MNTQKIILLSAIIAVIMLVPNFLQATSEAGVIFLLIEPGSRPGGMAEAHVAQVDDAFAAYWNPGAMAFNRKTQTALMHSNWLGDVDGIDDIYLEYLGFNKFIEDVGNIGMNITYLTYGKQTRTNEAGTELGTFSSYEVAAGLTYGAQMSPRLGLGVNWKFILSDLAPEGTGNTETDVKGRGMSWAFDFALKSKGVNFGKIAVSPYNGIIAIYNGIGSLVGYDAANYYNGLNFLVDNLDFGVNLQNVGPDITYINEDQKDPLPMNWRIGFSYRALESDFNKLTINADMNKVMANRDHGSLERIYHGWYDEDLSYEIDEAIYSIGGEYVYLNLLALRAGYIRDLIGSIEGPSFGAGIQYDFSGYKLCADFAMQEGGDLVDYNKTFTLTLEF